MSGIRKLVSQTALYGVSSIIGRVLNVLLTPMYAGYYRPQDFGILSDLYAQLIFPLIILTFGLETTFFRYADKEIPGDEAYTQSFLTVFYLTLLTGIIVFLNVSGLANVAGYPSRVNLYKWVILITACDAIAALPMARLRFQEKAMWFATISLTNILVTILLNILFVAVLGLSIEWVFIGNAIASLVKLAMALYQNLPSTFKLHIKRVYTLMNYGFYIMLIGLSGTINEQLDKIMLPRWWPSGKFWQGEPRSGLEMNAIYNVSYKLGMALSLATQAFRYAAEPFFFKKSVDKNAPDITAKVFHYFVLTALSVTLIVSVFALDIVSFTFFGLRSKPLFSEIYWGGVSVVPLILLANTFFGAYITLSMWFKITGQLRFGLLFSLIGSGVTILINALFIPLWGYMASGVAHLLCYMVMVVLCYVIGQNYKPYPYQLNSLLIALSLIVATYFLIKVAENQIPTAGKIIGFKLLICFVSLGAMWWLLGWKNNNAIAPNLIQEPQPNNKENKFKA